MNKSVQTPSEAPSTEERITDQATSEAPSTEESTTDQATSEAPSTEENTTDQATSEAPSTEESTNKTTIRKYVTDAENTNDADIIKATDKQSTVEESAQTTNISQGYVDQSANATLRSLATTHNSRIIEADALANGYIKSQTDATNAANTLSGRAWIVDKGTPSTMSNGLTAVPEGTKVYLQWIDTDGTVSPTYVSKTTNKLSSADGSQVGPGAYAFDLRSGWIDANGTKHLYKAIDGQYYRLWIEDFKNENGNRATMIRQAGGFFPGAFVNSVTSSNLGQFPLIGTNMQRTGIYMGVQPEGNYMTTVQTKWIHDTSGPLRSPSVSLNAKNSISGQVWLETGAGDRANSGTGPNNNGGDPEAKGYTVVMSSLTTTGAQAYKAQVESLPESERANAAKALLTTHPEYISATVYGETDENGKYTLRFPNGELNDKYIYGYVMNPDGDVVSSYSSYTSPQFRTPNSNLSWTPQTAPAQNLVQNPMWYNVNFALVPTTELGIEIIDFNNTDKPAIAGDEVHIDLTGVTLSPLPTHIEWRDKNGNVVQKTRGITTLREGEQQAEFTVPSNAQAGDVYTAVIVVGGNDVAADSFIVKLTDARNYEPTTSGVEKPYGEATSENDVTGSVTVPNYPTDGAQPTITVDDERQLPDGTTAGTFEVDVTVTYPDGTKDKIKVPVTVGELYSDANIGSNLSNGSIANTSDHADKKNESNVEMNFNNNLNDYATDNKQNNNEKKDSNTLPDTGETTNQNDTIFGSLFAALGSLLLFRRRNKRNTNK